MGCKSACICGGFCPGCTSYEPETYFGHAEDVYDNLHGRLEQSEQEDPRIQEYYEEEMIKQHNNREKTK